MRCPLGFEIEEGDCPNAPCLTCMRNFGDGLMRDMVLLDGRMDKSILIQVDARLIQHGFTVPTRDRYAEHYFQECAVEAC